VPFTQLLPYDYDGAGDINSNIGELARWVRLRLDGGSLEERRIVSPENRAATRTPKVAITDKLSYALGWVVQQTPSGKVIWHNGVIAAATLLDDRHNCAAAVAHNLGALAAAPEVLGSSSGTHDERLYQSHSDRCTTQ
jgi:CubicO group peptidase (beta-lactamase class C family)